MPVVASADRLSGSSNFARRRAICASVHAGARGAETNERGGCDGCCADADAAA
jgi:hypothetical protein